MVKSKKKVIAVLAMLISTASLASFVAAFNQAPQSATDGPHPTETATKAKGGVATPEDFKSWLKSYKNASDAEKELVMGMLEADPEKAKDFFESACADGDERGCMQLGMLLLAQENPEGLDKLKTLAISGKDKGVSKRSALFIGAYVLDFAPGNKVALDEAIEAVVPHAGSDAEVQFVAANLLNNAGFAHEADKMLTQACTNRMAPKHIVEICMNNQGIEIVDESAPTKNPSGGSCPIE